MRPPRVLAPGESAERDPIIDDETVKEIESFYDRKRLRDEARAIAIRPRIRPLIPASRSSPHRRRLHAAGVGVGRQALADN